MITSTIMTMDMITTTITTMIMPTTTTTITTTPTRTDQTKRAVEGADHVGALTVSLGSTKTPKGRSRMGTRTIALWAILVTVLTACGGPAPGASSAGSGASDAARASGPRKLVVAIRGDPKTLSAKLNSGAGAGGIPGVAEIEELLSSGLGIEDPAGVIHPLLAELIPSIENGLWQVYPDGRMLTTWRIRDGAVWHDGTPFTAQDLTFTAEVERDRELPIFRNVAHNAIEQVEAVDDRTIQIHWKSTFIEADSMFTSGRGLPMPRHLLEETYRADKSDLPNLAYWNENFVGTGPFKLREFARGTHLILDANERYVLGRPKIDQIEVRFIPDPATIGANILAGGVDLTLGGRLSLEWAKQVRDQWNGGKMTIEVPRTAVSAYPQFIDPNPPVLLEAPFRRALLHAVDRQALVDTLLDGLAPVMHSIIPENHAEYADVQRSIVKYDYDPRRAAQLIDGLGYTKGPDGNYRDPAGRPLTLEVRTTANDDGQMKTMLTIAASWQQLGIPVEQVPVPPQRESDREYRATRPAFEVVRQPGGWKNLQRFYGPNTPLPQNDFTGVNRTRHRNPEFDALIDRFFSTVPHAERMNILNQVVSYMTTQVVILGMFYDPGPTLVSNRVGNMKNPGAVWDAYEWTVQ
jgi:peptide/nickel transport system substrate-binding protein